MARRRSRKSRSIAVKSLEIALAAPQVVAHRVARMALGGPKLSERDRREFQLMVHEKHAAFGVLAKGLAPIHRKAVSNARRLAKITVR